MSSYLFVIEPTGTGFSAYVPDLPGCAATGATRDEAEREVRAAIDFHIAGLRHEGYEVPRLTTSIGYAEVAG